MLIKLDAGKISTGSTVPPPPWLKILVTRMLTRDPFAVAKLFDVFLVSVFVRC